MKCVVQSYKEGIVHSFEARRDFRRLEEVSEEEDEGGDERALDEEVEHEVGRRLVHVSDVDGLRWRNSQLTFEYSNFLFEIAIEAHHWLSVGWDLLVTKMQKKM